MTALSPGLRARILPKFPANVLAGAGMTIVKSGLDYTFSVARPSGAQAPTTTVAALPAPSIDNRGQRYMVTDSSTIAFWSIVGGGGSSIVPVTSDGTNWRIG